MKIRNLQEYINHLTENKPIQVLGASNDPLLTKLAGEIENLSSYIGPITKHATNTGAQIFYEFLQNADDEGAKEAFFYFDEYNFVVINNGIPFNTDIIGTGNSEGTQRKGQLKSFLAKQKGNKYGDKSSIGRYGQGSKLLYDLLIPVHKNGENIIENDKENALIKEIIDELKGPIIFSWKHFSDLERLFGWRNDSFSLESCADDNVPLLTKIVFTFYPAGLSECANTIKKNDAELFRIEELKKCISFLNDIRQEFSFFLNFKKGTLIYIPLGEGQNRQLNGLLNQSLLLGIATSLVFLKNLENVQVLNKEVKKPDFIIIDLPRITGESEDFKITIGLPRNPKEVELINFYQFFPITKTMYGLKFIIQSKAYSIGGDRQQIDLGDQRNQVVLEKISESIGKHILSLHFLENREELIELIKCIVSTDTNKIKNDRFIEKWFYQDLLEVIKNVLPTTNGFSNSPDSIKIKRTDLPVSPSDFGFEDWNWLDEGLADYYDEIKDQLEIEEYSIIALLEKCTDREKLSDWFAKLSAEDFLRLLTEIEDAVSYPTLKNLPIVHFSNGETYTLSEIEERFDLYFITPELEPLESIFKKNNLICGGIELFQSSELSSRIGRKGWYSKYEYLKRFASAISELPLNRDDKWKIFRAFKDIPDAEKLLKSEMLLFENQAGEKRPLDKLIRNATNLAPSGILQKYAIKASEIFHDEMNEWMMQEAEIWDHLIEDWEENNPPFEAQLFVQAVGDLQMIFEKSKSNEKFPTDKLWICTDENGWITSGDLFYNKKLLGLSKTDYLLMCEAIKRITDLRAVPYNYLPILQKAEFADLSNISLRGLSEHWLQNGQNQFEVSGEEFRLITSVLSSGSFFNYFIVTKGQHEKQYLIKKKATGEFQYFSKDQLLNQFLITKNEFFLLPGELELNFQEDTSLIKENEGFANQLIDKFGAERAFINMVVRQSENVKLKFLTRLDRIELSSGPEPKEYKEEFEGKIINIIATQKWENNFKDKIYIDESPLDEYNYNEKIVINNLKSDLPGIQFSLSKLNSFYEGKSDALAKVRSKLDGIKTGSLFSNISNYDLTQLKREILELEQIENVEQLGFLITFFESESGKADCVEADFEQLDLSLLSKEEALQSFFEKKIYFCSNYPLPVDWFDLSKYIDTSHQELILPKETVPQWIANWKNERETDEKTKFLIKAGLQKNDSAVIECRKRLNRNEMPTQNCIDELAASKYFSQNTLHWLSTKFSWPILNSSEKVKACNHLIQQYLSRHEDLPDYLLSLTTDGEQIMNEIIEIDNIEGEWFYVESLDNGKHNEVWVKVFLTPNRTFIEGVDRSYKNVFYKRLEDIGIKKCFLKKEIKPEDSLTIKEWDVEFYKIWREDDGKQYSIFLSDQPIPFEFSLDKGEENELIGKWNIGEVGRLEEKGLNKLYLHIKDNENVLKILGDNQDVLFKGDAEKLVKLMTASLGAKSIGTDIVVPIGGNGGDPQGPVRTIGGYHFDEHLSEEEYKRLNENLDIVKKLLNVVDSKLLDEIIENIESIIEALEKRDKKVTPNSLVGLIGERLVVLALQHEHPLANIEYVAYEEPRYDIVFDDQEIRKKIDVKSTIHSIFEEGDSIPFFLKKSQFEYIRQNPNENYFIIRLSLFDLKLDRIYEKYKDRIGEEVEKEVMIPWIDKDLSQFVLDKDFLDGFRKLIMTFKMNVPPKDEGVF